VTYEEVAALQIENYSAAQTMRLLLKEVMEARKARKERAEGTRVLRTAKRRSYRASSAPA